MKSIRPLVAATMLAALSLVPAHGEQLIPGAGFEPYAYATPDDTVRVQAGVGAMYLEGNEFVYVGDRTLSHLIWQTKAPVLRGSIALDVGNGFSVKAEGSVAGFGSSYMEDYDWLVATNSFDNWTHRSQHPDTSLDHYWTGAASVGFELANIEDAVVRLHGGLKYTDVQWTARGGSYVYSTFGFRDSIGSFPDGALGITYRQQLPEVFLGIDGDQYYGNVRVGGLLRGGLTMFAVATDDHWMRDRRFVDSLYVAPTFSAAVDVGFPIGGMAEFTLAARYDHIFRQRGDTKIYNKVTGALLADNPDTAGGQLHSAELMAGVRGSF